MAQFRREYYLVGGTAIALHIGHRRSVDFDMFKMSAVKIFGELFSEKLFRAQLSYFDDIDYTESVEYLIDNPPSAEEIKSALTMISIGNV